MAQKFREIVIRSDVTLPALSTEVPERSYSFLSFLQEWVLNAREMRKDENLVHLFAWEETLEAFTKKMADKAGVCEPPALGKLERPEPPAPGATEAQQREFLDELTAAQRKAAAQIKAHNDDLEIYTKATHAASVGEVLYVTDEAFKVAKEAAKSSLDKASTPNQQGATQLARAYESKVLRHYHAFGQSKAIDEKDVPRAPEKSAVNGEAKTAATA